MSKILARENLQQFWSTFLLPEQTISLKLVFDNVRNYVICAGLFAAGVWLKRDLPASFWPPNGYLVVPAIAAILLALNVLQSVALLSRLANQFQRAIGAAPRFSAGLLPWALFWILAPLVLIAGAVAGVLLFLLVLWALGSKVGGATAL